MSQNLIKILSNSKHRILQKVKHRVEKKDVVEIVKLAIFINSMWPCHIMLF
jgi:hypothetical protein